MRVAIVVILGAIMSVLDTTIVNVALHDLSGDLHAPLSSVQWVITGYLLSLAAVIPVTGWAVRRYSARRLYLIALVVFTAGSARQTPLRSKILLPVLKGVRRRLPATSQAASTISIPSFASDGTPAPALQASSGFDALPSSQRL